MATDISRWTATGVADTGLGGADAEETSAYGAPATVASRIRFATRVLGFLAPTG
jgi:hypothetical protein